MIYFDENKNAYAYEIDNYIATVEDDVWAQYATTDKWDIVDGEFVDISDTEEYKEKKIQEAKQAKYTEANVKAFQYLESGEAVFTYEEGKSIEATDGNIAKLGLALVNFILDQDYTSTIEWNTKENENVQLNAEQLQIIVKGLQYIQSKVWTIKFPAYNTQIREAQTIQEVNSIIINYGDMNENTTNNNL